MNEYLRKREKAFQYAWQGILTLFKKEAHAKIHAIATVLVVLAGFIFGLSSLEWCAIILCIVGVLMAEGFNTAIERVCDRVCAEHHPLIKESKDVAAGAVLIFVIGAVIVGLIIFVPKIFNFLSNLF